MAYVRKVKTASGATAVQIVEKRHGVRRIVAHVGSAHDDAELSVLMRRLVTVSMQASRPSICRLPPMSRARVGRW